MMHVGVDYYPEHWPKERWSEDARLMRNCKFNVVRLAEFSWCKLEPESGVYDFNWLDEAIEELTKKDIQVILCTPTASPPAWLIEKYRDILPVRRDKSQMEFGERRHYCITNENYRRHSHRIVEEMAKHYRDKKEVIGWQVDNELGYPKCYCKHCQKEFQKWLKEKYGSLEKLNKTWGTIFWSQEFTDWNQIPLPWEIGINPSLFLDYCRFFSDKTVEFSDVQIEILKRYNPDKFVTHNFMGLFDQVDYYALAKNYDFVSWDTYPERKDNHLKNALAHDIMRGLKKKNFWIMEQQCSYVTREGITPTFGPGEMRLWTYQSLAGGADGILYFRWRPCLFGDEQYHSGILQHDGTDQSLSYKEVREITKEIEKISDMLEGAQIEAPVAIIWEYENIWSVQSYRNRSLFNILDVVIKYYKALKGFGINVDIVHPNENLGKYKIVIAPLQLMVDDKNVNNLYRYVENGGHLISTFRTGIKGRNNNMISDILPGKLKKLFGIKIHIWDILNERETLVKSSSKIFADETYKADTFADLLEVETAKVLATYDHGWHSEYDAVTVNEYGSGKAIYVGTNLEDKFYRKLLEWQLEEVGVQKFKVPEGVEISSRQKGEKRLIFILNFGKDVTVELDKKYFDLLSGKSVGKLISTEKNGVRLLL